MFIGMIVYAKINGRENCTYAKFSIESLTNKKTKRITWLIRCGIGQLIDRIIDFMFRVTEEAKNTFAVILELNDVVETDAGLYKVKQSMTYSLSIYTSFVTVYKVHGLSTLISLWQ